MHVEITVPQGMIAVSQGTLAGTTTPGPGRTAYRWRERHPISTYLVSIAAHAYAVQTVAYTPLAGGSMPVTVWSYPEDAAAALEAANLSVAVLRTYSGLFGEYPFVDEKYGYAQCNFGGGMEHQTATSAGNWSPGLVVHETAHQWFGDAVTLRDFSHIWLNEGFATYAEALWAEAQGGRAAYLAFMWARRSYAPGTIWVPHPETTSFGRIFDASLSYSKAAWVLHMLRGVLGDDVFFRALRAYAQDSRTAYGTATTEDLQAIVQEVSGRDLSRFFTNWIYRPYYPTYLYDFSTQPAGGGWNVHLDIQQLQSQAVYDMPLPVRVLTRAGNVDVTLPDSMALQSFDLHVAAEPLGVQIDPEHWVLHSSERALHDPTFSDGVLVVNGVSWVSPFAAEAADAYRDSVFAGRLPFKFWDLFPAPAGGYVPQLPAPIGHGPIPPEMLGRFSTVVWIGNVYAEDLDLWNNASIVSYLQQGGNVLLLARRGQEFLSPPRSAYLGLRWAEDPVATLGSATPARGDLVPMSALNVQTQCAAFETGFDAAETQLLFTDATYFAEPRGIGAWRRPAGGGSVRPNGGNFAFVSGRPYRWAHGPLRANVQTILSALFLETATPVLASIDIAQESDGIRLDWRLEGSTHISNLELRRSTVGEAPLPLAHWVEPEPHGTWLDRDARTGQLYSYELLADFGSGPVRVAARDIVRSGAVPVARTRLLPVTPNPFNPGIVLHYELARPGRASLRVLDAKGRRARLLFDTELPSGSGTYLWDGRDDNGHDAASGVYLITLECDGLQSTAKATLAR